MDTAKQYTLSDLTRLALGSAALTKDHLNVLQMLLTVLLNKLNCQNETVCIAGIPAQCVKGVLEKSHDPPFEFGFHHVRNFQQNFDQLHKLEIRAKNFQVKMEKHFDDVRKRYATVIYSPKYWDLYAQPTEDLCTLYRPGNRDFCIMARNPTFNKEMRLRMTQPVLERMNIFDHKVDKAIEKLKELSAQEDEKIEKFRLVEHIVGEIESSRQAINKQWLTIREAMEEIQEMLSCKLDRITLPAIRKYVENRYNTVGHHIKILGQREKECPAVNLLDARKKGTCLSCNRCEEIKPLPVLDIKFDNDKMCECHLISKEPTILQRMDKIKVKSYRVETVPGKASLFLYNENNSSTFTHDLRNKGDYVQVYASYDEVLPQNKMRIKPLITVAETSRGRSSHRRLKSFNPINSYTMMVSPQRRSKSKLSIRAGNLWK